MRCEQCEGTGLVDCEVSQDGGKTWSKYNRYGERATATCDNCAGTGNDEIKPSNTMPVWAQ